ncbi:MAG: dihydrodipicolinate reductase [Clostridia bacterium]|nr:dihydrodipicolinate reductase [Clostridia bacterium]
MAQIKVVQYGCGKMSVYTIRYALEKGYKLVGAFDINPKIIGKDAGKIAGLKPIGVIVEDAKKLKSVLTRKKPDIVIVTTRSLISELEDVLTICAECGVNAITTCEEAFFPQNSNPTVFNKIDKLARKNKCVITGAGYQDVFWGNLIAVLAGATHKITKIKGKTSYNVEDYGIALAEAHGAGMSLEEFDKKIASVDRISKQKRQKLIDSGEYAPSYMWNTNGWLADRFGWTITEQTQKCVPQTSKKPLNSTTLGMKIPAGYATGMSAVVTSKTKEGIIIESECIGKVYAPDEFDSNEWTIYGEPDTTVIVNRPATVELTCATIVNRIPDVINNKKKGYVPTSQMPVCEFARKDK